MGSIGRWLLAAGVFAAAGAAQASFSSEGGLDPWGSAPGSIVQVVLDVTPTSRSTASLGALPVVLPGQLADRPIVWTNAAGPALQGFSLTVTLDTTDLGEVWGELLDGRMWFFTPFAAAVPASPYSVQLAAGVPTPGVDGAHVKFGSPIASGFEPADRVVDIEAVRKATVPGTGSQAEYDYRRTVRIPVAGSNELTPKGTQLIAQLQARVGHTFEGAYSESFLAQARRVLETYGDGSVYHGPDSRLSAEGTRLLGDVTIRSVSVSAVPEPSAMALASIGVAVILGAAMRRRQAGQAAGV